MLAELQICTLSVHKEDQYTYWKVFVSPSLLTVFRYCDTTKLQGKKMASNVLNLQ
jgi:hypothetical protein